MITHNNCTLKPASRTPANGHWLAERYYNLLVRVFARTRGPRAARLWERLWQRGLRTFSGPIRTRIHGRQVVVNYGYPYPVFARCFHDLNAPLIELACQTWRAKGSPIRFADIGAGVGDTVLLLYANLPKAFSGFVCVEGDGEFLGYLQQNLAHLNGGRVVGCTLSAAEEDVPALIRTHAGTASAQGAAKVRASTLSRVLVESVDLLKIDVDGFDGRVLAGAAEVLHRCRPTVIFEWYPILCRQAGNNWTDHFEVLQAAGYSRFVWFTKFGNFSHFLAPYSQASVDLLADHCLADVPAGWHYDIVALHDASLVSVQALAALRFARNRRSRY